MLCASDSDSYYLMSMLKELWGGNLYVTAIVSVPQLQCIVFLVEVTLMEYGKAKCEASGESAVASYKSFFVSGISVYCDFVCNRCSVCNR